MVLVESARSHVRSLGEGWGSPEERDTLQPSVQESLSVEWVFFLDDAGAELWGVPQPG